MVAANIGTTIMSFLMLRVIHGHLFIDENRVEMMNMEY